MEFTKSKTNMRKIIKFGEDVEGNDIPVLNKRKIRKTSGAQFLVLLAFVAFMVVMVWSMNERFSELPYDLFGISKTEQAG